MNNNKTKLIAFIGVMASLEFVVLLLETYVFGVLIPIAPPCILSISIAITLSVYDGDYKKMFIGGTILGVCSFIISFIVGLASFMLPWISILPRIFIGIVAFFVTKLFGFFCRKIKNNKIAKYLPYIMGAIFGVLTNTVLTLFALYFGGFIGMEEIVATFIAINFPLEVVGSAILVPVFVNTLRSVTGRKYDFNY